MGIFDNLVLLVLFLVPGFLFAKVYRVTSRYSPQNDWQTDLFFFFIYGFVALLIPSFVLTLVSRVLSVRWTLKDLATGVLASESTFVALLDWKFMVSYYGFLLYVVVLAAIMGRHAKRLVEHRWTQKFFNRPPKTRAQLNREQAQEKGEAKDKTAISARRRAMKRRAARSRHK